MGRTGLEVFALGLGAGHIGRPDQTERDAGWVLDAALEPGITFVDTARGYELSEYRIGQWLPAHRDEVVIHECRL